MPETRVVSVRQAIHNYIIYGVAPLHCAGCMEAKYSQKLLIVTRKQNVNVYKKGWLLGELAVN